MSITEKYKEICIGCELEGSKYVECKGIHYCANPLCTAVGSTCHKANAPGVYPNGNGYEIKEMDFFWDWCKERYREETDPNIKAAMERTMPNWEKKYKTWYEEHGEATKIKRCVDVV